MALNLQAFYHPVRFVMPLVINPQVSDKGFRVLRRFAGLPPVSEDVGSSKAADRLPTC